MQAASFDQSKTGVHTTLGTYTKSIHASGKAKRGLDSEAADRKSKQQAGRYALMRTAQGLLWKKNAEWRDQNRTCWCSRSLKRDTGTVSVYRNEDGSGASLTGLNRCGNIWTCPVCAAKVAETRRAELSAGLVGHLKNGGAAYLLTLTFPHEADHPIAELLERFTKARQSLQNSRSWKRIMSEAGRIGSVASLEVTISQEHGWHPHLHLLIFGNVQGFGEGEPANEKGDLISPAIRELKFTWTNILLKCGLGEFPKLSHMIEHALNVRGGNQAAEYIAKYGRDERWGQSSEMTRHYNKQGSAGERDGLTHFTPFQLLTWAGNGDEWSTRKFLEYAEAIEGKRAVTWSPGLKKSLGVNSDQTDEEIAADDSLMPEQIHVGELEQDQYQIIFRHNRLPDFIRYVANSATCQGDIDDYIQAINTLPPTHSGAVIIKGAFHGRHMVN